MLTCEYCSSYNLKILCQKEKWKFIRCNKCKIVFLDPKPSEQQIIDLYRKDYYPVARKAKAPLNLRRVLFSLLKRANQSLPFPIYKYLKDSRAIAPFGSKKILDVGCGTGEYLALMKELGWETYGNEVSREAVEFGKSQYDLNIINSDFLEAEFPFNHFDLITFWHSFEHLNNPKKSLVKTERLLKKGGKIILETPNIDSIEFYLFREKWDTLKIPTHLVIPSPAFIKRIFNETGFRLLKLKWVHTQEGLPRSIFGNREFLIKIVKYPFIPLNLLFDLLGFGGVMRIEGVKAK